MERWPIRLSIPIEKPLRGPEFVAKRKDYKDCFSAPPPPKKKHKTKREKNKTTKIIITKTQQQKQKPRQQNNTEEKQYKQTKENKQHAPAQV